MRSRPMCYMKFTFAEFSDDVHKGGRQGEKVDASDASQFSDTDQYSL